MGAQLSKIAALPLAKILATASCAVARILANGSAAFFERCAAIGWNSCDTSDRCSKTGPRLKQVEAAKLWIHKRSVSLKTRYILLSVIRYDLESQLHQRFYELNPTWPVVHTEHLFPGFWLSLNVYVNFNSIGQHPSARKTLPWSQHIILNEHMTRRRRR